MDRGPIWTERGHNRNQSIKAEGAESRNLALSSSTYPGVSYKLNPAVRTARLEGNESRVVTLKAQVKRRRAAAHTESQGKLRGRSLGAPDGSKI